MRRMQDSLEAWEEGIMSVLFILLFSGRQTSVSPICFGVWSQCVTHVVAHDRATVSHPGIRVAWIS